MSVLVYLVPAALLLGLLGLAGFMWSLKTGQYEDLEGAAWRILEDDDIEDTLEDPPEGARGHVPEGEERRKG
ncbi:cbb3-type cytochrome oxidase assembly protein CcoS [Pleomorphomonas sp. PLEO]|uniref:cbb3-type cytochrome oxidase assembly protein CcoS n=1 Tax=Pleomorphomonas sp. PLEO TaxID=3239306 RepID=UPI00351DF9B0